MIGTVRFILCKMGRKVDTEKWHIQTILANGAKRGVGDGW